MKKALSMLTVLCVTLLSVQAAGAAAAPGRPPRPTQSPIPIVYETPFNVFGGAQVEGSEGKVDLNGNYKVELLTEIPSTSFDVCMIHSGLTNGPELLQMVMTDPDGQLLTLPDSIDPGHYEQFSFTIHAVGLNGPCSGDPLWISGFTIQAPQ